MNFVTLTEELVLHRDVMPTLRKVRAKDGEISHLVIRLGFMPSVLFFCHCFASSIIAIEGSPE